jgi:hypothetical protein
MESELQGNPMSVKYMYARDWIASAIFATNGGIHKISERERNRLVESVLKSTQQPHTYVRWVAAHPSEGCYAEVMKFSTAVTVQVHTPEEQTAALMRAEQDSLPAGEE